MGLFQKRRMLIFHRNELAKQPGFVGSDFSLCLAESNAPFQPPNCMARVEGSWRIEHVPPSEYIRKLKRKVHFLIAAQRHAMEIGRSHADYCDWNAGYGDARYPQALTDDVRISPEAFVPKAIA